MNEIKNIPLKKIYPNPDQPRKYFDPEAMDALTASIERYGVLSPITVREAGDGKYELISGERRYRAAYKAGLKVIPCIIIDAPHSDCAILSLLENLQREDLSFLEIAESYKYLVKDKGYTSYDLSRRVGDRPYDVKERIRLMKLDPIVRKYIRSFGLTERQAAALVKLRDHTRQLEAVQQICENSLSESDSIDYINGLISAGSEPKIHINRIKDIKLLRNTLNNAVGLIRRSGIDAELTETAKDGCQEFLIIVRN
ncbi:MAG: ParB/RepB/Spo0J family partition protein [Clostridia bacterium]|nr:ParB/RepB/Spo0J family partition protein [Clostridia bacterium]